MPTKHESTNFELVSSMNEAFGNPKGDPKNINWLRLEAQCKNIHDEFNELMNAIEGVKYFINYGSLNDDLREKLHINPDHTVTLFYLIDKVRDALCDIHVFAYGAHHLMGIDADMDMQEVVSKVMTRFCADEEELQASLKKWRDEKGLEVYVEGEFPRKIVKSAKDQPDAPKGKFLKSAFYSEPVFYEI